MNLTASNVIKLSVFGVVAFVIWRTYKPLSEFLSNAGNALDNTSAAAGELAADVTSYLNGHEAIELVEARIPLLGKYVDTDYTVNQQWIDAITENNTGVAALFYQVLDIDGRLKPEYRHLVDGELSAQTILDARSLTNVGL